MPRTQSINQNASPYVLPNFRNMGVVLRILLMVNGMALLASILLASSWSDVTESMLDISALLQPLLLLNLLLLYFLNPWLGRLTYRQGFCAVLLLVMVVTLLLYILGGRLYIFNAENAYFHTSRNVVMSMVSTALLLFYFRSRAQVLSPALQEARLQALQARIRPHFLFNTITAVLGIMRADPKRAETALEDMADLFRMSMAHNKDLVPVGKEVALARQYLALEQLRLGDRLTANWSTLDLPDDALIPPLMLQPLLENAVYHGIEPLTEGGVIDIKLYRSGKEIHLEVRNPCQAQGKRHSGCDQRRRRLARPRGA